MDLNLKNIKKILLIITFSVLLYVSLQHVKEVVNGVQWVFKLLYPIILGFAIAFVLNVFMKIFETQIGKFFKKSKNTKLKKLVRPLAILVTLAFAVGVLLIVGLVVIPELIILAETLGAVLPVYIENVYLWVEDIFLKFNIDVNFLDSLQINWDAAFKNLIDSFLKSSSIFLGTATTAVSAVFSFIANFTIGIVLAIYVLFHKEKVCAFSKGLSKATFPKKVHSEILRITSLTSDIFSKFIVGQLTEAVILGSLCFVGMLIFRFPHAMVISIFTMITALIPIIGAFLGGAVGFVLILMVSPFKAVLFLIFIIVLQQLEGDLIYPKVVGKTVGLPSLVVLIAIVIGGNLGGITGILFAVPVSAVIYVLLKEFIAKKA